MPTENTVNRKISQTISLRAEKIFLESLKESASQENRTLSNYVLKILKEYQTSKNKNVA
jgi:predicted DNA-binding ribbon-helix-helix protein